MTKIKEEIWKMNEKNFLKVWRDAVENKSAIVTLFHEVDILKKKIKELEKFIEKGGGMI